MKKIKILVKPGSRKGPLVESSADGCLTVFVQERAIEGAANKKVAELLAKHFGVSKSQVSLKSGARSRHKIFLIKER